MRPFDGLIMNPQVKFNPLISDVFGALQGDWLENSQEEDQFVPEVGCK